MPTWQLSPAIAPVREPQRQISGNIAQLALRHSADASSRAAFLIPSPDGRVVATITYGELAQRVASLARELTAHGIGEGQRVLLLLPMSADLYAVALAILAIGATVTLVDGGRSRRRLLAALAEARAHAVIGTPRALWWWPILSGLRRTRRITLGGSVIGCTTLAAHSPATGLSAIRPPRFGFRTPPPAQPAITAFSSGNTGRAKAIARTHEVLASQHAALAATFPFSAAEINLPGFPMATLHNLCGGVTTVLASPRERMDGAAALLNLVEQLEVTSISASPRALDAVASEVLRSRRSLPTLRRIVVGGGPVSGMLSRRALRAFPHAEANILYGATEAEPITTISMAEAVKARGRGYVVGRAAAATEVTIDARDGEAGEVLVRGAHVAVRPGAVENGWHRTGDIGTFDTQGRLWLLGRQGAAVAHRGVPLHPYVVEADVLMIPGVRNAALVSHRRAPHGELALCADDDVDLADLVHTVRARLEASGHEHLSVRLCDDIPMDERHGSKIARDELARRLARSRR